MSDYKQLTRHPLRDQYHFAEWKDDYFGPHLYGVKFPDDTIVYPAQQVKDAQLLTFWADDVLVALGNYLKEGWNDEANIQKEHLKFLSELSKAYKARWKRDPIGGEGAVNELRKIRGEDELDSV